MFEKIRRISFLIVFIFVVSSILIWFYLNKDIETVKEETGNIITQDFTKEKIPTLYIEKVKQEIIKDNLVPQCSMNDCPEYKPMDVDGDGRYESVVLERTAMTQQAGRIWVIDQGEVVFKSDERAQIGVSPRDTPDKQSNGFIISYATESPMAGEKVFLDSFKKDYYLFKDGKYILEKTESIK